MSSHEALRKRVETILDMAVSTVSSLAESFVSGVSTGSGGGVFQNKANTIQAVGTLNKDVGVSEDFTMGNDQKLAEKSKDEVEEESSELTEQSDEEGGMLEVHG